MDPVVVRRQLECRSAAAVLWPVVTDTERLNRATGMKRIVPEPLEGAGAARFLVRTRLEGWDVSYEEPPFEWVEHERMSIRRTMHGGPVSEVVFRLSLAPRAGGGTLVTLELAVRPRTFLIRPIARISSGRSLALMARELAKLDAELAAQEPPRPPPPTTHPHQLALARAEQTLLASVPEARRALAARLVAHVGSGSDFEVARIRPFELADDWAVGRDELLAVCLGAVVAGLLELTWELVCPSCRTGAESRTELADLPEQGHCQLCDLGFGVELDRAVEATFRPAPPVRAVDIGPYCIGGPARTPHVVAQAILPAGGVAELKLPASPGRFRLFVRGGAVTSVEAVEGGAAEGNATFDGQLAPARLEVGPGATIRLAAGPGEERHAKLERVEWASRAATAHHVAMNPVFRRLFAGQVLRPGVALKVGRVALLFSDLTGSTALYTREGDATAFGLVQDHFELLRGAIEQHHGVVVKTIGDAIMAAFLVEEDAVRAGLAMQRGWPAFRAAHPHASDVFLKIGLFSGPCYTVTANGVLDYFGQTVNVAARLQAQAESGEVVIPAELADAAEAGGWLTGATVTERFAAELKGLDGPVKAARLSI